MFRLQIIIILLIVDVRRGVCCVPIFYLYVILFTSILCFQSNSVQKSFNLWYLAASAVLNKMSALTATKNTSTKEDDDALLSAVTAKNILSQLRADSEYDKEDDELTSRTTPTGSPPPVTAAITDNPTGMNRSCLII